MLHELNFVLPGPQLTEEMVAEFEAEIGGAIDDDFKAFLLAMNGGVASPELPAGFGREPEQVPAHSADQVLDHRPWPGCLLIRRPNVPHLMWTSAESSPVSGQ